MTRIVLFDMDGTLADDAPRRHFYDEQNWEAYFSYEAQMADHPYPQGRALYEELLADSWEVGYLTARLERNRPATEDWLAREGFIHPDWAILRPEADALARPPRFKASVLASFVKTGKYSEVVLVDNDPFVIERVTAELGPEFCFWANWDKHPEAASLALVQ